MPKLKSRSRSPGENLLDKMSYYQSHLDLSHKEWAAAIKIPYETLLRREKAPDKFTIGELSRIAKACGISVAELFSNSINIKE